MFISIAKSDEEYIFFLENEHPVYKTIFDQMIISNNYDEYNALRDIYREKNRINDLKREIINNEERLSNISNSNNELINKTNSQN